MRVLRCLVALTLILALGAQEAVVVKLAKRGNIRYGPSTQAKVATTLDAGTEITVLGSVRTSDATWYQIRFPREGKAWMHEKVLKDNGDGTFVVTEDKARVRGDSTMGADIVAELAVGDIVEARGNRVGDWLPVYPRNAVAYAHEILLNLPKQAVAQVEQRAAEERSVDPLWQRAKQTYVEWTAVNDLQRALAFEWAGLSKQLAIVGKTHAKVGVQLDANRLKDQVDAVVREQQRLGAKPTVMAPEPVAPTAPQPAPVAPQPVPVQPVAVQPVAPQPAPVDPQPTPVTQQPGLIAATEPIPEPTPEVQQLMGAQAAIKPTGGFTAEGFLEQRGIDYLIVDRTSQVVAMVKPNGNVQLSDYFWREVGIKGQPQGTVDMSGVQVSVILVDDVVLLNR